MTEPVRPAGLVGPVPPGVRDAAIEAAAKVLLGTAWPWRGLIEPQVHRARDHYCADCPLCRPDYGDNAQRIAAVVLDAVLGVLAAHQDEVARTVADAPAPDETEVVFSEASQVMRQFYCDYRRGTGPCSGGCWTEPDCAQGSPTDGELLADLREAVSGD